MTCSSFIRNEAVFLEFFRWFFLPCMPCADCSFSAIRNGSILQCNRSSRGFRICQRRSELSHSSEIRGRNGLSCQNPELHGRQDQPERRIPAHLYCQCFPRFPLSSDFHQRICGGNSGWHIPPELQDKYLNIISHEADRLEKLTRSLLVLNDLDERKRMMNIRKFDINDVIKILPIRLR